MTIKNFKKEEPNTFCNKCNILHFNKGFFVKNIFNPQKNKKFQWILKRFTDITVSCVGLVLLIPLWIFIFAIIKLESKGPAIHKQKRIGFNQKEFYMYKFRTMTFDAEEKIKHLKEKNETNPVMFKISNDPRVTKIGKFLRKYSLDEFPQLINVIKGEMSLVGPRPPLPSEVEKYEDWHYIRFLTLPGLTGKWQVNGRSKIKDFNEVVYLDFQYIQNWCFLEDLKILLKTIPVVLFGLE